MAAFVAVMLLGGRRVLPWVLWQISNTGSRELFTLCVVAVAVGIAYGAAALVRRVRCARRVLRRTGPARVGVQPPCGRESLPLRDAFAVLFFVSVGMLFDPAVLVERPLQVLAVTPIIVIGKSIAARCWCSRCAIR